MTDEFEEGLKSDRRHAVKGRIMHGMNVNARAAADELENRLQIAALNARIAELEAALKEAIGIAHDAALVLPPKASTTEYIQERIDALREILKRK